MHTKTRTRAGALVALVSSMAAGSPAFTQDRPQLTRPAAAYAVFSRGEDGLVALRGLEAGGSPYGMAVKLGNAANFAYADGRLVVQRRNTSGSVVVDVYSRDFRRLSESTPTPLFFASTTAVAPWVHFDREGTSVLVPGMGSFAVDAPGHVLSGRVFRVPRETELSLDRRLEPASDVVRLPLDDSHFLAHSSTAGVVVSASGTRVRFTPLAADGVAREIDLAPDSGARVSGHAWLDDDRLGVLLSNGTLHTLSIAGAERLSRVVLEGIDGAETWTLHAPEGRPGRVWVGIGSGYEQSDRVGVFGFDGERVEEIPLPPGSAHAVDREGRVVAWSARERFVALGPHRITLAEGPLAVVPLD